MNIPRRRFLQLAAGASSLPAMTRTARAQIGTWRSLDVVATSAPAVCSWGPSRLDVFARGEDFALWHKFSSDPQNWEWSNWQSLGGTLYSPPAAVSWAEGRLDVFVRGADRALWHKWFTAGAWSDWESLGGALNFGPAVTSSAQGRLDVFARGTDNTIFQRSFNGQNWIDWVRISKTWETAALPGMAAVSSASLDTIDLFTWVESTVPPPRKAYLVHKSFCEGRWKDSNVLGDIFAVPAPQASTSTSLAVASWRFSYPSLDWFMRAGDNTLGHSAGFVGCGGDVSVLQAAFGPTSRGGVLTSGPAAVAVEPNRIAVVVRGGSNILYHMWLQPES
jgi:hypothetical protein